MKYSDIPSYYKKSELYDSFDLNFSDEYLFDFLNPYDSKDIYKFLKIKKILGIL
uniref:Uncharacterized protein n=1 Tax=viral metagenome TaxID=1070528 RepID=A0A6C0ADZ0_9ZZZZ